MNESVTTLSDQFKMIEESVSDQKSVESKGVVIGATRNSRKRPLIKNYNEVRFILFSLV